jgi:hypothetical protein
MREGPVPRAALLGTSRWALLVALFPLILTFGFLHYHYSTVRALRQQGSAAPTGKLKLKAADLFAADLVTSRQRGLLHSSDVFDRPLRDGCDLAQPGALAASLHAHRHARALFSRNDLAGFLSKDLGYSGQGALIGVGGGSFADTLLGIWNCSQLHLVDPWRHQPGLGADANNVRDEEQETLLSETHSRLNSHVGRSVRVVRETSTAAAGSFEDCSLDLVYIDQRRDYLSVLADLIDYWPKVKPGGILAGMDYLDGQLPEGSFGVKTAVDRFAFSVNRIVYATQVRAAGTQGGACTPAAARHWALPPLPLTQHHPPTPMQGWPISENSAEEWSSFYLFK